MYIRFINYFFLLLFSKLLTPSVYNLLTLQLSEQSMVLDPSGIGTNFRASDNTEDSYVVYGLIAGVGLLAVVLMILTVSCWFNVKGYTILIY